MAEPEELLEPMASTSQTELPNEETPTSLVKGQLLTQALPPYMPSAVSEERLFGCPVCGDRFLLEASLVRHLDRRSVFIAYGCRICDCSLEFYNRCALLAHIREHSLQSSDASPTEQLSKLPEEKMILGPLTSYENGEKAATTHLQTIVEPDSLILSPVPRSKIDIGPFVPIPVDEFGRLLSKSLSKNAEVEKISQGVQVTDGCDASKVVEKPSESIQPDVSLAEQKGDKQALSSPPQPHSSNEGSKSTSSTANIQKGIETNQSSKLSTEPPSLETLIAEAEVQASKECKECGKIPEGELKDHYQSFNAPLLYEFTCTLCKLILPTRCSLMAHKRIHLQKRPFICPECAREFSMWASFYVHMLYTCFHMFKEVRYRCMQCRCLFVTELGLQSHIVAVHVKHVFKCDVCPIACFSTQTLREHKVNTHGQSALSTHSYQQCQLCPDRLIPKHKILSHVNEHCCYPTVRIYVYKCNTCSQYTTKKSDFATHKSNCRMENFKGQISKPGTHTNKYYIGKNANQKSIFKVFCEVPQSNNNMKISFAPKPVMQKVNLNKVLLTDSEPKELQPRTIVSNKNVNRLQFKDSDGKVIVSKFSVLKGKSLAAAEDKGPVLMKREQIYLSDSVKPKKSKQQDSSAASSLSKTDKKDKEQETAILRIAEEPRTSENAVSTVEGLTKVDNTVVKTKKILQSCAVCHKTIPYYVQPSFQARLPVICSSCSRDHAFVRKAGKFLIVPKKSLANFMKMSDAIINGKLKDTSQKKVVNGNCDANKSIAANRIICPLCDMHISMEYDKLGEHYKEKHPECKFLFPVAYKLKLNNALMNPSSPSDGNGYLQRESSNVTNGVDLKKGGQFSKRSLDSGDDKQNDGDSESKRKRKSSLNLTANDNEKAVGEAERPLLESGERKFICFKCKYTDRNEKSFREHIIKHRTDDNAYQCMECGMCFVVRPSFEKHLFIWHRIKDAEAYIQANDCCDRLMGEDSPEDFDSLYSFDEDEEGMQDSLAENQCRVCREMFDSPSQLNLHFRTHD